MNSRFKKFLPILCFVLFLFESFLIYSLAPILGISENSPWFIFVYYIVVGTTLLGVFWSIGLIVQNQTLKRLFKGIPTFAWIMGLIMAIINLFYPVF